MKHQWVNDQMAFGMPDLTYCRACNTICNFTNLNSECVQRGCGNCLSPNDCVSTCSAELPVDQQPLVYRLRKRAEIRRQIPGRKSVEEGTPDRIADLLEEAANALESQQK